MIKRLLFLRTIISLVCTTKLKVALFVALLSICLMCMTPTHHDVVSLCTISINDSDHIFTSVYSDKDKFTKALAGGLHTPLFITFHHILNHVS
jgi:hypothetical protein